VGTRLNHPTYWAHFVIKKSKKISMQNGEDGLQMRMRLDRKPAASRQMMMGSNEKESPAAEAQNHAFKKNHRHSAIEEISQTE
jgi:phage gp16-like protein